jgi:hypothetical protein
MIAPLARINLFDVVATHIRTFHKFNQTSIYVGDLLLFFGLPAVAGLPLAYYFSCRLYEEASNLLSAASIIGGFLFSLLAMTSQLIDKVKSEPNTGHVRKLFAKEIHANVAFGIVSSLSCVVCLVVYRFGGEPIEHILSAQTIMAWFTYFNLLAFFLTLLMIVNRLFIILNSQAREL